MTGRAINTATATGLTAIIPCYNEGAQVEVAHAAVCAALDPVGDLEVLFIDDGSSDDTLARIKAVAARDPRVRYVSFARNFGLPAAVTAGFRYAGKPWAVQLDADLQFPAEETWALLDKAAEGYDVVFGVRRDRKDNWLRRVGAAGTHRVARGLLGIEVPQGASSFRVVRTAVGRTIVDLPTANSHFVAKAPQVGARYTSVPVAHRDRTAGTSKFRFGRLAGDAFELLLGFSWRPLNIMYGVAGVAAPAALLLALLGVFGLVAHSVLLAVVTLVTALGLASTALVGRYLHRRMLDARPRRHYYVREATVDIDPADMVDGGATPVPPPTRAEPVLVVLGAGEEQVVLYREARRRGLRTVAVDMRADRPGIALADEFLPLSTTDHDAIAAALAGRPVAGVVSTAADTCLESWQVLSERFATPWRYPAAAVAASMDKSAFHRLAAAAGVATYRWAQSDDLAELAATVADFRFPVVVKPTDASGCRGVLRVDGRADLGPALANAAVFSPSGQVIVEEFLAGRNFTVNVFLRGGAVGWSLITEKRIDPGPRFLILGHQAPAVLDPAVERALLDEAAALCAAMDLPDGPANFDVVLSPDGTRYVLEVGARLSGNGLPGLAAAVSGVDIVGALLDLVLGEPFGFDPAPPRPTLLHVLTSPLDVPGEVVAVGDLDAVRALPAVAGVDLFVGPGDRVLPFTEAGRKLGWLVVSADEPAGLDAALAGALAALDLVVAPVPEPVTPATVAVVVPAQAVDAPSGRVLGAGDKAPV
ncbi:glycosyltransferase [Actinokineospora spheciospongiae]|uniref:glycosyltransferase n=1 Tax=Actinokineospora spheciospongiae TaxID=909613 RepID=UPI000D80B2BA|nr:glycosyltransferase [Actinokineospora spheciospongiae]PWW51948.1 biotin carboxylase [Actinokineospora spheciospongiae]